MRTIPPGRPVKTRMETRRGIDEAVPVMMVMTRVRLRVHVHHHSSPLEPAARSSLVLVCLRSAKCPAHGSWMQGHHTALEFVCMLHHVLHGARPAPRPSPAPPVFLLNKTQSKQTLLTLLSSSRMTLSLSQTHSAHTLRAAGRGRAVAVSSVAVRSGEWWRRCLMT
jgi:hypothetical protein